MPADRAMVVAKCACGKVIRASITYAGQKVTCPQCGQPVTLPKVIGHSHPPKGPHGGDGTSTDKTTPSAGSGATDDQPE